MFDFNPFAYLVDVLPRIPDHPINRISELLPRQWAQARKQQEPELTATEAA